MRKTMPEPRRGSQLGHRTRWEKCLEEELYDFQPFYYCRSSSSTHCLPVILVTKLRPSSTEVGYAFLCRDSVKLKQVQFYSRCSIGWMVFLHKVGSSTRLASSRHKTEPQIGNYLYILQCQLLNCDAAIFAGQ